MALLAKVKALDEVPEAAHAFYTEVNGEFVLDVDGMVTKDKLDEFRTNNRTLKTELDALKVTYEGIDPQKAREMAEQAVKIREKKLIESGKVDDLITERTNAMKVDHEKQLQTLTEQRDSVTARLEGLVIDGAIRDAAAKAGVRATATEDVLLRGRALFRLHDGKAIPMDGDKPIYGKDGGPMDIGEWVGSLTEKAPHLFEVSKGGGAREAIPSAGAGARRISRDDRAGFLANLEGIATGKAAVV
jgi:hypothetical protein